MRRHGQSDETSSAAQPLDQQQQHPQPQSEPQPQQHFSRNRVSRGRGLRKTTGCLTCRRRHVRCDEAKPQCSACTRIRSECIWAHGAVQRTSPRAVPRQRAETDRGSHEVDANIDVAGPLEGEAVTTAAEKTADQSTFYGSGSPNRCQQRSTVPREYSRLQSEHDEAAEALVEIRDGWHASGPPRKQQQPASDLASTASFTTTTPRSEAQPSPAASTSAHVTAAPIYALAPPVSVVPQQQQHHGVLQQQQQIFNVSPDVSSLTPDETDWLPRVDTAAITTPTYQDFNVDEAAHVWASLLLADASRRSDNDRPDENLNLVPQDLAYSTCPPELPSANLPGAEVQPSQVPMQVGVQKQRGRHLETEAWQESTPLELAPHEYTLFRDFIQNLSLWMDLFDPKRPFGTLVPHMALRNRGLFNAILALSVRHLSLNIRFQPPNERPQDPLDALPFYFTTLHYIRDAMQYESYKASPELLATASIVSAYEMLDGSRQDWERHLRGLSIIQYSQGIHGDSGGLKQAVWWAWLCQDVWAAWRESRKPFSTWRPDRSLEMLDSFELAARSVYLFGRAVAFCSRDEVAVGMQNPTARLAQAEALTGALDGWFKALPLAFEPLPVLEDAERVVRGPFTPLWIHPPCFGVALQMYHCSQILLITNTPCFGGMNEFKRQRLQLDRHVQVICGIAMHLKADPASVMCSQALFIAGLFITRQDQREAVLELLDGCWRRAGWPHDSLGVELEREWNNQDGAST